MARLTPDMRTVIETHTLGYVASVGSDGTPNLSPKATMLVLDDERIAFGDLRSPNTVRNLSTQPVVEINFVDVFARKGCRIKGPATYHPKGGEEFENLLPRFSGWGDLSDQFRGIVVVDIDRAVEVISPAYDHGADEAALRAQWRTHFLEQG